MANNKTYTPLLSEVLKKVHNAKTKEKKIEILREYDCEPLRMLIKGSFDPKIEWLIPEGNELNIPSYEEKHESFTTSLEVVILNLHSLNVRTCLFRCLKDCMNQKQNF
jgi:hypothetical protein